MMWLKRAPGYQEPPRISPIENNPVGWSSIYPPQVMTNPDPNVSLMARSLLNSPEQRLGHFWNVARGRAKPYTERDLPALAAAGQQAMDYGMAVAGATQPLGIRGFHGSPHKFEKFDLSRMGTGEGAQSYGAGGYIAQAEPTAETYLGPNVRWTFGGRNADTIYQQAYDRVSRPNAPPSANAEAYFWEQVALGQSPRSVAAAAVTDADNWPELARYAQSLPLDKFKRKGGHMYEVNLRTSPERLIDWDKPFTEQPQGVQDALRKVFEARGGAEHLKNRIADPGRPFTGAHALEDLGKNRIDTMEALRDAGIDGVQYFDQASRGAGEGTRNYVMFRDDIIDILRRYGLFGLAVGGAGAAQGAPEQ